MLLERKNELEHLQSKFEKCKEGEMQISFIKGRPGMGKTFLVEHFLDQLEEIEGVITSAGFCNAKVGDGDPYLPLKEVLNGFLKDLSIRGSDDKGAKRAGIFKKSMLFTAKALFDHAPDLIDLFVPAGGLVNKLGKYALEESGIGDKIKDRLYKKNDAPTTINDDKIHSQYVQFLIRLTKDYTVVIFIDDLHWIDESSANLFSRITRNLKNNRIFIICSFRSNYGQSDHGRDRHMLLPIMNQMESAFQDVYLDLDLNSYEEKLEFLSTIIDKESNLLDNNFKEKMIRFTDGNALFMTELYQAMKNRGDIYRNTEHQWVAANNISWDKMPSKAEAIVKERVERLDKSLRQVLSLASVQGKEFIIQVISKSGKYEDRELVRMFTQELNQEHLLVEELRPIRKNGKLLSYFEFADDLTQKYLYEDLGESEKMYHHEDIANALEKIFKNDIEEFAHLLAYHYEKSGNSDKAVEYYEMAGHRALKISAFREAAILYQKALDENQNDYLQERNDETLQKRLKLLIHLSVALKPIEGWANKKVVSLYIEAKNLGIKLNNVAETSPVLFGLWVANLIFLELEKALENAYEIEELALKNNDYGLLIKASISLTNTYFWLGDLEKTKRNYDRAFDLYDSEKHKDLTHDFGQDPRSLAYMFQIIALWITGEKDLALKKMNEGYDLMMKIEHPFSLAILICTAAWLSYHNKDKENLIKFSEELMVISEEHGFLFYLGMAKMFKGYHIMLIGGDLEEAHELIDTGYKKDFLANGGKLYNSIYTILKCDLFHNEKRYDEMMELTNEAIQVSNETGEKLYISELMKFKALALYKAGEVNEANSMIQEARALALTRGAKALVEEIDNLQLSN